jgi:hypothetical protein
MISTTDNFVGHRLADRRRFRALNIADGGTLFAIGQEQWSSAASAQARSSIS